jgi:hypothetical protein
VLGVDLTFKRQSEYNRCQIVRQGKTQEVARVVAVGQGSRKDSVIPTLQKIFDNLKRERLTTVVNKIHAETRRTSYKAVRSIRFARVQYRQR